MTKRTMTSLVRHYDQDKKTDKLIRKDKALIAQARELVTCRCGRSKMLSVGQIWRCKHKD